MFRFIQRKIQNNMWLTLSLILGMAFMITVVCCQPMFEKGSLDRMIRQNFNDYIDNTLKYPVVFQNSGSNHSGQVVTSKLEEGDESDYVIYEDDTEDGSDTEFGGSFSLMLNGGTGVKYDDVRKEIDDNDQKFIHSFSDSFIKTKQNVIYSNEQSVQPSYNANFIRGRAITMEGFEEHAHILKGEYIKEVQDDYIPCVISVATMDRYGLVIGENVTFYNMMIERDNALYLPVFIITGVYDIADGSDPYWQLAPSMMTNYFLISEENMKKLTDEFFVDDLSYDQYYMLDYQKMNYSNIENIYAWLKYYASSEKNFTYNCKSIMQKYMNEKKTIGLIIWVLELPVLGMVFAFILMVSNQIVEVEKNEIATLKSRGISKLQIILTYFIRFAILALISLAIGLFLGYWLCKLAAGTTNFLTFSSRDTSDYVFNANMVIYGIIASVVNIIIVLIPVFSNAGISIVQQKADSSMGKKPFWFKYFLDLALLLVAVYLAYNYHQTIESIKIKALAGDKLDPIMFLDAALFILSLGMVMIRFTQYFVNILYKIMRRRFQSHTYVAFMQVMRHFKRQSIISMFIILTVGMGIFYANTASTVNQNHADRISYENGADIVLQEKWIMRTMIAVDRTTVFKYEEPDYTKYEALLEDKCQSLAKVLDNKVTFAKMGNKVIENCHMMGIDPKQFGETAELDDVFNKDYHWYNYLNKLASNPTGVIISRNLAEDLGVTVGQELDIYRNYPIGERKNEVWVELKPKVLAIVDVWPGYLSEKYVNGEIVQEYLIVANSIHLNKSFGLMPYSIWLKLKPGVSYTDVLDSLSEYTFVTDYIKCVDKRIQDKNSEPMIQITNGIYTMSFIISMILCMAGFLIYWITSINQRELLFGVYRAMGMSMSEINNMLIIEHVFGTFLSVVSGGIVGISATIVFIKVFCAVYLPEIHKVPLFTYYNKDDVIKLAAAILFMILVCLLVIRRIIAKMNISQALKLGEE